MTVQSLLGNFALILFVLTITTGPYTSVRSPIVSGTPAKRLSAPTRASPLTHTEIE